MILTEVIDDNISGIAWPAEKIETQRPYIAFEKNRVICCGNVLMYSSADEPLRELLPFEECVFRYEVLAVASGPIESPEKATGCLVLSKVLDTEGTSFIEVVLYWAFNNLSEPQLSEGLLHRSRRTADTCRVYLYPKEGPLLALDQSFYRPFIKKKKDVYIALLKEVEPPNSKPLLSFKKIACTGRKTWLLTSS